jgi:hypothetical protein
MEGLVAGALFLLGSLGLFFIERGNTTEVAMKDSKRRMLVVVGLGITALGFVGPRVFLTAKLPNYLAAR